MRILALELSSARGSIALQDTEDRSARAPTGARSEPDWPHACAPQKELFSCDWANDRKNSGPFFEHLAEVQKQFGKADTVVIGLGPGSYAGTRIAISAAIGLCFRGTGEEEKGRYGGRPSIRLIGYPSICAIQCDAPEYCVINDARRNSFFYARVCDHNLAEGPTLMDEAELRQKLDKLDHKMSIFTTEKLPQFERAQLRYPAAKMLAQLAGDTTRKFTQPPLEPMYLREPHITLPRRG